MKTCAACGGTAPVDSFHRRTAARDGRQAYCKACARSKLGGWQAANADRVRELFRNWTDVNAAHRKKYKKQIYTTTRKASENNRLRRTYGISLDDYETMCQAQDGGCLICRTQTKLCIDHDHKTGAVRGLLCRKCNTALGQFRDDPEILRKAAAYLEAYSEA